jgi:hypothetical protein
MHLEAPAAMMMPEIPLEFGSFISCTDISFFDKYILSLASVQVLSFCWKNNKRVTIAKMSASTMVRN